MSKTHTDYTVYYVGRAQFYPPHPIQTQDFWAFHSEFARTFIMDENFLWEFRTSSRLNGVLYRLWWLTSDCGRSLLRWSLVTGLLTLLFAALYTQVALDLGDHPTPLSYLYFSVVTLTTLGYGDIVPNSTTGQILVIVEVCIGYMLLGGLISIFANKLARRGE